MSAGENKYKSLIRKVQTAIVVHDGQGRILDSNPMAHRLLGLSSDQLLGKSLIDPAWHFLREDGSVMPVEEYPVGMVLSKQEPLRNYITGIRHPNRKDITWALVNAEPEYNDTGQITRIIVSFVDITVRKQTEEALKKTAMCLNEAQHIAHIGSWELDLATNVLTWSDEVYRIFEIDPDSFDASYEAFLSAIHPEDREAVNVAYTNSLKTRTPYAIDHRLRFPDGRVKFVHERCETYYENDKPVRSVGTVQDITERKRAEQNISLLSFAMNNVREAAFLINEKGRFHFVNKESCRILGYTHEELLGMDVSEVDPDFPIERWPEHWNDLKTQRSLTFESRHKTKDGSIFPVEINANYFEYEGKPYNLALVRDITERKQAEEKMLRSEQRLRLHSEQSPIGFLEWDDQFRAVEWNAACERIFGYTRDEAIGRYAKDLILPPEVRDLVDEIFDSLMNQTGGQHSINENVTKDGRIIICEWYNTTLADKDGKAIGIGSLCRDITEHRQAEEMRKSNLHFFESMDKVNRAIQGTNDLETMMSSVLDEVLSIFDCDRAFLLYPCDPETTVWRVPMERTRPEYPGAMALGIDQPIDPGMVEYFRLSLNSEGAVKFGPNADHPLPEEVSKRFGIKSIMTMAAYPKMGSPWQFGIHQCSYARTWTPEEERLLLEIGRRLEDALTTLLTNHQLQESEQKYRTLVENTPDFIVRFDKHLRRTFVNSVWEKASGLSASEVLHVPATDTFRIPPPVAPEYIDKLRDALENGTPQSVEFNWTNVYGEELYLEYTIVPEFDPSGRVKGVLAIGHDITDRKRNEEEISRINRVLRMLSDTNQALIHIQDETSLLNEVCRIAVDVGGYRMAWVGFAEHDETRTIRPMAQAGFEPGYLESAHITWADEEHNHSPCGIAIRTGRPKLIRNILSDPSVAMWKEAAVRCGYQSVLALPLICDDRTIGSLGIYADQEDVFDSKEVEILKELASDMAFGISALRIRKQRNQAEAALRESQVKYIDLYENAPDMYASINAQTGLIEQCNRTLANALGYSKEEVIGRAVFAIYHPDCLNEAKEIFRSFLKTGRIHDKELQLQKKDGSKLDISLNVSSVCDEKGTILYSRSTLRDITERKRSEDALRRLNRKLMAISGCTQALLRAEDEQTLLNEICRTVCDKAGYHVAWVGFAEHDTNKTIRPVAWAGEGSEYIVTTPLSWSESSEYGQGLAGKSIRSGQAIHVQDFMTDPSMVSWRPSAMKRDYRSGVGVPLKDEKNKVFGVFMIYSSEPNVLTPEEINLLQELAGDLAYGIVSLRIRAEHKQMEEALAASERDFRSLSENSPDNIVRYDRQCRAIYCNPMMLKTLALGLEIVLGKTPVELGIGAPEINVGYEKHLRRVLESGESSEIEIVIPHPEGGLRSHLVRFAAERDKDGSIIGVLAIGRDITARKQAEQEREKLLRDLNAKNKELQSIVYISSHDLKTPLVNIKGFSHLLNEHCRQINELVHQGEFSNDNRQQLHSLLSEDVPEDLNFVSSSADRMSEMIEGLLRVSRIGVSEIQMKEVNMNKMISKIFDMVKYPIDTKKTEIVIDRLPNCTSDEDMLKQLFSNLIDNALKYFDPARKGRIHISGSVEGDNCIYCVEDNGIGIATEHQSKIFELYHRLNPEGSVGGEGLGLTIVSRILDKLNGHIHVESDPGKGSRFFVSLPRSNDRTSSDVLLR